MSAPQPLRLAVFAAALLGPVPAKAEAPDPWAACTAAAAAAEQDAGIPSGLLLAIGKVESGRVNPGTGRVVPWPYALNIAGRGVYPLTAEAAATEVRAAQAEGLRSIDVGCFQISLLHHPGAFASLDDAFDPPRNAAYAARFLASLRAKLPSWELAAGGYHSMTPAFGERYAARVMATWSGSGASVASALLMPAPQGAVVVPVAFRVPAPRGVRVHIPGATEAGTWAGSAFMARPRLPVVYAPDRR